MVTHRRTRRHAQVRSSGAKEQHLYNGIPTPPRPTSPRPPTRPVPAPHPPGFQPGVAHDTWLKRKCRQGRHKKRGSPYWGTWRNNKVERYVVCGAPGGGRGVVWPFGRSAQSRQSTLLVRSPLKLLTRELLGRKGVYKGQRALTAIETTPFFSQRLRSLRAIAFPCGLVPSPEL